MSFQTEMDVPATASVPSIVASVVIDELIRNGVEWFIYCPGSRNGPLGFELVRRANTGEIKLQVRLDERSAAFVALGITKATGVPAVVVTTSGTAVSNLLPAVTEANYTGLPLVLITANRPPEVLGTGASQTVEQTELLTSQVRNVQQIWAGETMRPETNGVVRSQVCRALGIGTGSLHARPGPVQIDVPLSSGLPPEPAAESACPTGRPDREPWIQVPERRPEPAAPYKIDLRRSTIVVAGDGADLSGIPPQIPCVAEPTVDVGERVRLHPWVLDYVRPQQVVICGRPTLHRNVGRLLARPEVTTVLIGGGGDWLYSAPHIQVLTSNPVFTGQVSPGWIDKLGFIDVTARRQWSEVLAGTVGRHTGLGVANAVLGSLCPGDVLWVGASNPIRDASLVGAMPAGVEVLSNRGVAGIDGNVSAAIGVALARPERTVVALLGDLTFAYDASGLQTGRLERVPENLTIVVSNDAGGGIFELLEQGHAKFKREPYGDTFERIYGTPQRVDIAQLCGAYGVAHRVSEVEDLSAALRYARGEGRLSVLEVPVARTGLREVHAAARQVVDATMDSATHTQPATESTGNLEYSS